MCSRRQLLVRPFVLLAVMFILADCSSLPRTPYTAPDAASSTVLDLGGLRVYADEPASTFLKTNVSFRAGPLSYLALSGGGADGVYGLWVLKGWTAAGARPGLLAVSGGVRWGMIASFAFFGRAAFRPLPAGTTSG